MTQMETLTGLPLWRRFSEILKAKGPAYSQTAFAYRLGYSRETLRLMLSGQREIYDFEMKKIIETLRIPLDRILQQDVIEDYKALQELLKNLRDNEQALFLAQKLASTSIGLTEKCLAIDDLGRAHYLMQQYEEAHQAWLEAYGYAEVIQKKYKDSEPLLLVISHLMLSYTYRKEYANLTELVSKVESSFDVNPARSAVICYSLAKIAEESGNIEEAEKKYYMSLHYYEKSGTEMQIGGAKMFTANFEFRRGNYTIANSLYQSALHDLKNDKLGLLICQKEYAKNLLKMGNKEESIRTIDQALSFIIESREDFTRLESQFYILLSVAHDTPYHAESVVNQEHVEPKIRIVACQFLMDFYEKIDDSQSFLKYYRRRMVLANKCTTVLEEGDL